MEPLIDAWLSRGYCFILDGAVCARVVWADDIFLFASRHGRIRAMTEGLSADLALHGLFWKPPS
eukprot:3552624-Pyramimonas_sp.AAC.1